MWTVPFLPVADVFVQQLATEGPMGRTVKDVAMLLSIQAGRHDRAPLSFPVDTKSFTGSLETDMKGKKIAWLGDWGGYFPTEPGLLDHCKTSLKVFADMGCEIEEIEPFFDPAELWDQWLTHRAWLIGNSLLPYYNDPAKRALMKDSAQWEVEQSFNLSSNKVLMASMSRSAYHQSLVDLFSKYDFVICPTASVYPFDAKIPYPTEVGGRKMETYHQWMGLCLTFSLAGTPVMNLPVGLNKDGLPMGVQLVGKRWNELGVIQAAAAYEKASQFVQKQLPKIM